MCRRERDYIGSCLIVFADEECFMGIFWLREGADLTMMFYCGIIHYCSGN